MVTATTGDALAATPPGATAVPRGGDDWAVVSEGLSKSYGGRRVVDALDLRVPAHSITGFVGPNGAGKTTTLRMLLGLVRPTSGRAEVLGVSIEDPRGYMPQVGALIEGPAFYPTLSGRRNLEVLATLGGHPRARIDEILETVELSDRAGDLFRSYSMGMKQRLGVAAALLPSPRLLILDEPTNGLDPSGIIETRNLLRRLRDSGMTIFVSSHLLAELEQVAESVVLLSQGRLLFQGPIGDLLGARHGSLLVAGESAGDLDVILAVARRLGLQAEIAGDHVRVVANASAAATLNRAVMGAGVALTEITAERATLEETFLAMTGGA